MKIIENELKPRPKVGASTILRSLFFTASFSCLSESALATDWSVFTTFDSLTYSDSFSIYGLLEGVEDQKFTPGGDASYTFNQWTIGARKGAWELGVFTRYDYLADHTPAVSLLVHANESSGEIPNGRYDIDLKLNHSRNYGLRLGYTHAFSSNLSLTGRLSGLAATEIVDGDITGELTFTEAEVSEGALAVDYRFTDDLLFGRNVDRPTGYGFSIDTIVNWRASDKLNFELSAYDIFNRIWWDNLTGTIADATTAISRTAENGVLIVRPTLQGQNLFGKHQQKLRTRLNLRGVYEVSNQWRLSQEVFKTSDNFLVESGASYQVNSKAHIGANYEWVSGAPGVSLGWNGVELGVSTDNLDWKNAQYLKVHIGLEYKF